MKAPRPSLLFQLSPGHACGLLTYSHPGLAPLSLPVRFFLLSLVVVLISSPPPPLRCWNTLQISRAANTLQQETDGGAPSGGPADIDTLMDELEGEHEKARVSCLIFFLCRQTRTNQPVLVIYTAYNGGEGGGSARF